MPKQQNSQAKGCKKLGRNSVKCSRYKAMHTREKNKVRRVLRASGLEAAQEWARENGVSVYLSRFVNTGAV